MCHTSNVPLCPRPAIARLNNNSLQFHKTCTKLARSRLFKQLVFFPDVVVTFAVPSFVVVFLFVSCEYVLLLFFFRCALVLVFGYIFRSFVRRWLFFFILIRLIKLLLCLWIDCVRNIYMNLLSKFSAHSDLMLAVLYDCDWNMCTRCNVCDAWCS